MHYGILGPGGVGGLIGAVLANAGEAVTMIVRPDSLAGHPRRLSLESKFGMLTSPVAVAVEVPDGLDVLWITVKATQLREGLRSIPLSTRPRAVVPLLNGIDHVALLRERFGHQHVVPATIAVESERIAAGVIVHRSPWVRLNAAASGAAALEMAFHHFSRFGFECSFVENETQLLWRKLAFLAPIALSTTAAASPIGEVLASPERRARFEACSREACAVGNAAGASLDPEAVQTNAANLPPEMRSSMQKDAAAGKPLELDAIAGPILRGATRYGLPAPATSSLVTEIESRLQS